MEKKYFFFDIDGTLTDDSTHKIVPSSLRTLHALEENGHFVSIATGRIHYKAKSFADSIGIHNLVCSGGGCLVLHDEILKNEPLNLELAKEILRAADQDNVGWILLLEDTDAVFMKDFKFLEQAGRRNELTSYHYDPSLDYEKLDAIYKIYLAISKEDEDRYPWLQKIGYLRMGASYVVCQYDKKKEGIINMMNLIGGSLKDVVVFGDGKNDLVMFDPRWFSIAMGNGEEDLKAKANYVTDLNINDGIEKACKKFGWITD